MSVTALHLKTTVHPKFKLVKTTARLIHWQALKTDNMGVQTFTISTLFNRKTTTQLAMGLVITISLIIR